MAQNEKLSLLIAGDVFPVASNREYFEKGDTDALFGEKVMRLFSDADYSVCNTEGCIADHPEPVSKLGPVVTAGTASLSALQRLGIRAVTLGNTHIMDGGRTGFTEYTKALDALGIDYFGAGSDLAHMKTHIRIEMHGIRVILYNVTEFFFNGASKNGPGAHIYREASVLQELWQLKKECDHLIVLYHGGAEATFYNTPVIRKRFHRMAEAGADILISQHTHAIGEEERYRNSLLIYGQGNFCFNLAKQNNPCLAHGMLLSFAFTKKGYQLERHVVRRTETGCEYDPEQDLSGYEERSRLHERLLAGDPEADAVFRAANSEVSHRFMERFLHGFYGEELPVFSKKQLQIILTILEADEIHEMAVRYFSDLLEQTEKDENEEKEQKN